MPYLSGTYCRTGAAASSAPYDDVTWTNPTNIYAADANNTTCALTTGQYSYLLKASNFGLAIPSAATITGLQVQTQARCTAAKVATYEMVQLLNASGTAEGDNNAADTGTIFAHATTGRVDYFGHSSDMWNVALTPTMMNDSDFGVQIAVKSAGTATTVYINYVLLNIFYTTATTCIDYDTKFLLPDYIHMGLPDVAPQEDVVLSSPAITIEVMSSSINDYFFPCDEEGGGPTVPTTGQLWPRGNF